MGLSEEKEEVAAEEKEEVAAEEKEEEVVDLSLEEDVDLPSTTNVAPCKFCSNSEWETRISYKCGTVLSKYFPSSENNPAPGWYKGTITKHYLSKDHKDMYKECIWNEIHYEDGDMEKLPQEELSLDQIKILHSPPAGTASSSKKRRRQEKEMAPPEGGKAAFSLCYAGRWNEVLPYLEKHPMLGMTVYKHTTLLFLAIGNTDTSSSQDRFHLIMAILKHTPAAATIQNSHGNLPLHAICSRNVRLDAPSKTCVRRALINAYPAGLLEQSGKGKTPLHILMTDYFGSDMMEFLTQGGEQAVFLKDANGHLPIHELARYRPTIHPMKMLLDLYPGSIGVKTITGKTVYELAKEASNKCPQPLLTFLWNAQVAYQQQVADQPQNTSVINQLDTKPSPPE